jgi:hypothetical protein
MRARGVDQPRGGSARLALLALLIILTIPAASYASPFRFGMSASIVVRPNEDVTIFAEIINTGDAPLVFGCALIPCGGLDFGTSVGAGLGEGLNALQLNESDPTGSGFYAQFSGVTVAPGSAFDFVLATMSYDPTIAAGNPLGTVLHPIFGFRIGDDVRPAKAGHCGLKLYVPEYRSSWPTSFALSAPGLGRNFCTRPLNTSAR